MSKRKNPHHVDTWISEDQLKALEKYMEHTSRSKADAIRLLIDTSLMLQGMMTNIVKLSVEDQSYDEIDPKNEFKP